MYGSMITDTTGKKEACNDHSLHFKVIFAYLNLNQQFTQISFDKKKQNFFVGNLQGEQQGIHYNDRPFIFEIIHYE